jgi:hypothetical protein
LRITKKGEPVEVVLIKPVGDYPVGHIVKLMAIAPIENEDNPKKPKYIYSIAPAKDQIIENVARDNFTTFYYKDSKVIHDILIARGTYKTVVKHLNALFNGENEVKIEEFTTALVDVEDDE